MPLRRVCLPLLIAALGASTALAESSPAPVKPSSFAPHVRSHRRVFGAPIQKPILTRRAVQRRHPIAATR